MNQGSPQTRHVALDILQRPPTATTWSDDEFFIKAPRQDWDPITWTEARAIKDDAAFQLIGLQKNKKNLQDLSPEI